MIIIMYIDFHVHAFPNSIAQRAMENLSAEGNSFGLTAHTDGTVKDLENLLKSRDISHAVLLPIATKPSQQNNINTWASEVTKEGFFYSFGSVHPDAEDRFDELERIKSLGLYGVKLHPDYQKFMVDDEKIIPVYKKCAELDLPIMIHSGFDPVSPELCHCKPENAAKAYELVPECTMILAHAGAMCRWDEVEKYLAGMEGNLYFDVSVVANYIKPDQLLRIIRKHGADRILFGSDSPWDDPENEKQMIKNLPLSDEEKDMIFYKNALKILKINR